MQPSEPSVIGKGGQEMSVSHTRADRPDEGCPACADIERVSKEDWKKTWEALQQLTNPPCDIPVLRTHDSGQIHE